MNKLFNLPIGVPRSLTLLKFDVADPTYKAAIKTNESNERIAKETNETNVQLTRETNESNLQQVRETNQANKDIQQMANDLQISESDKAYERSTATNQIAELVRAGYSTQQAKQIVAGSGSPATYQPAQIGAAQMQAGQSVAPQVQPYTKMPEVNDSLRYWMGVTQQGFDLANSIGNAFTSPDGGAAGNIYASGVLSFINENAQEIYNQSDGAVNTLMDFRDFCMSQPEDSKYRKFIESDKWKRIIKFAPAARAVNANMQQMFADNTTTNQQIVKSQKDIDNATLKNRIDAVTADIAENGKALEFLKQKTDMENYPTLAKTDLEHAINSIAKLKLDTKIITNKNYERNALALALKNQDTQMVTAQVLELQKKLEIDGYKSLSEEEKSFLPIVKIYSECGVTDTEVGTALSLLSAGKVPIIPILQKAANKFFPDEDKARNDWTNSPDVLEVADYSKWSQDTKWKRFFGSLGYDYQPKKDSDGVVRYYKVKKLDFWSEP